MNIDLNVRTQTIKLKEENMGENFSEFVLGKNFLHRKNMNHKGKNTLNFTKIKNCFWKDTLENDKLQSRRKDLKNIFDKLLSSRIYKNSYNLIF